MSDMSTGEESEETTTGLSKLSLISSLGLQFEVFVNALLLRPLSPGRYPVAFADSIYHVAILHSALLVTACAVGSRFYATIPNLLNAIVATLAYGSFFLLYCFLLSLVYGYISSDLSCQERMLAVASSLVYMPLFLFIAECKWIREDILVGVLMGVSSSGVVKNTVRRRFNSTSMGYGLASLIVILFQFVPLQMYKNSYYRQFYNIDCNIRPLEILTGGR